MGSVRTEVNLNGTFSALHRELTVYGPALLPGGSWKFTQHSQGKQLASKSMCKQDLFALSWDRDLITRSAQIPKLSKTVVHVVHLIWPLNLPYVEGCPVRGIWWSPQKLAIGRKHRLRRQARAFYFTSQGRGTWRKHFFYRLEHSITLRAIKQKRATRSCNDINIGRSDKTKIWMTWVGRVRSRAVRDLPGAYDPTSPLLSSLQELAVLWVGAAGILLLPQSIIPILHPYVLGELADWITVFVLPLRCHQRWIYEQQLQKELQSVWLWRRWKAFPIQKFLAKLEHLFVEHFWYIVYLFIKFIITIVPSANVTPSPTPPPHITMSRRWRWQC